MNVGRVASGRLGFALDPDAAVSGYGTEVGHGDCPRDVPAVQETRFRNRDQSGRREVVEQSRGRATVEVPGLVAQVATDVHLPHRPVGFGLEEGDVAALEGVRVETEKVRVGDDLGLQGHHPVADAHAQKSFSLPHHTRWVPRRVRSFRHFFLVYLVWKSTSSGLLSFVVVLPCSCNF